MQFLTVTDFTGIIGTNTLTSLRGTADANLDTSEGLAISELDPLRANFDITAELAKTGTGRNSLMIRLLVHITAYYLFNTVDDNDIPERIVDNYKMQITDIQKISTGKLSCTLDTLLDDDEYPKSNYRFGSNTPRDNDIF